MIAIVSFITAWMLLGTLWAKTTYSFFPALSHTNVQDALRTGPWWSKLGLLLFLPWFVVGTEAARLRERHTANEHPIPASQGQPGEIMAGGALPPSPPPPPRAALRPPSPPAKKEVASVDDTEEPCPNCDGTGVVGGDSWNSMDLAWACPECGGFGIKTDSPPLTIEQKANRLERAIRDGRKVVYMEPGSVSISPIVGSPDFYALVRSLRRDGRTYFIDGEVVR